MDHTFDFSSPGSSGAPETSAARLNSRCIGSTIAASARRIPISFAEQDALYSPIRIETRLWRLPLHDDANEPAQLGSAFLTALVIADCKRSRDIECQTVSSEPKPNESYRGNLL